jgi:hypothetical protein
MRELVADGIYFEEGKKLKIYAVEEKIFYENRTADFDRY